MKKKIVDVMIDFETFGRQPNSVPINISVIAWNRDAEENPFVIPGVACDNEMYEHGKCDLPGVSCMTNFHSAYPYQSRFAVYYFDVCACLLAGMTVEKDTQTWWMQQGKDARLSLTGGARHQMLPESFLVYFADFLLSLKKESEADEICIWAQGSDFDVAKLRWLVEKFGSVLSKNQTAILSDHTSFRDARTVILELGAKLFDGNRGFSVDQNGGTMITDGKPNKQDELNCFHDIYEKIYPMEKWVAQLRQQDGIVTGTEGIMSNYLFDLVFHGSVHNSMYDCLRSIYNVWWLNRAIDTQLV